MGGMGRMGVMGCIAPILPISSHFFPFFPFVPIRHTKRLSTHKVARRGLLGYRSQPMTTDPKVSRRVLPSGLTILTETLPYVRSVSLGYYLRSGSAGETEGPGGGSHF